MMNKRMGSLTLSGGEPAKDEKPVCVLWGCELTEANRRYVFEVEDDLLEHQLSIKTICVGAESNDELNVVAVESKYTYNGKAVAIASLRSSVLPMVSMHSLELIPPVTFILQSGSGPIYISGQHLVLEEDEETAQEEEILACEID
ncbi:nucleoplasmin-like [Latimeria chalumnae]|uniref:nucleoplasmin-like n=1 Tax=Latimeria chalumnae TaxID=7897 RepID=UPI00313C7BA7